MKIVLPSRISEIDAFAVSKLGISEATLIRRAGEAVAACVAECVTREEAPVLVLCGGGNNGADGYSAACALSLRGYNVRAVDVFDKGQRSEGGKELLAAYKALLGKPLSLDEAMKESPAVVIDAMFGTGFCGKAPERAIEAVRRIKQSGARVFAIDVPFGVDAAYGEVSEDALRAELTVVLSFMKRGLLSYPAKEYCGKLALKDIGLDIPAVHTAFPDLCEGVDDGYVCSHMPPRAANSHKGSYGRACLFVGSADYRGAAHLAAEAALRGGVGLLTVATEKAVTQTLVPALPEVLYRELPPFSQFEEGDYERAILFAEGASAVLIGCGSTKSAPLGAFVRRMLSREGAPLVLDADAVNALALDREASLPALRNAKREVLLTPHPLELSRLSGVPIGDIQKSRLRFAEGFAKEYGVSLLLKGAASVIATANGLFVNTTGSSALAKGGTGDVLAGFVTALLAQGTSGEEALRLGAYLHGKAAQMLEKERTAYGVLPSELPFSMAKALSEILKSK